jgi:hypothetical protein
MFEIVVKVDFIMGSQGHCRNIRTLAFSFHGLQKLNPVSVGA